MLGRPLASDTPERSLNRILWLSYANDNGCHWRRPLITAIVVVAVIALMVKLTEREFVIGVAMTTAILFGFSNYCRYHHDKFPWIYVRENLKHYRGTPANYDIQPYDL